MRKFVFLVMVLMTGNLVAQISILPQKTNPKEIFPLRSIAQSHDFGFQLHRGLILIPGKIGQQSGYWVLDTGAPSLMVNQQLSKASADFEGLGLGGTMEVMPQVWSDILIGSWSIPVSEGYSMDLQGLEQALEIPLLGLVGHSLFSDKRLIIDYREEHIEVQEYTEFWQSVPNQTTTGTSFDLMDHLPIVEISRGTERWRLALDTGAGSNVLVNESPLATIDALPNSGEPIRGLDQKPLTRIPQRNCALSLNGQALPCTVFNLIDLPENSILAEFQLDGVVGFPLLGYFRVTIDYPKQEIHLD
ncbi:MAG: hypothetical protein AAGH79_13420 [Bacteroidota bacterium]